MHTQLYDVDQACHTLDPQTFMMWPTHVMSFFSLFLLHRASKHKTRTFSWFIIWKIGWREREVEVTLQLRTELNVFCTGIFLKTDDCDLTCRIILYSAKCHICVAKTVRCMAAAVDNEQHSSRRLAPLFQITSFTSQKFLQAGSYDYCPFSSPSPNRASPATNPLASKDTDSNKIITQTWMT
jgi:hypothetical protein